jgi:hypothetical protein
MFWRLAFFKFSPVSVDVGGFVGLPIVREMQRAGVDNLNYLFNVA